MQLVGTVVFLYCRTCKILPSILNAAEEAIIIYRCPICCTEVSQRCVRVCPAHQLGHMVEVRTPGLGGTEKELEHIQEILMCGDCWFRDSQGLTRAMLASGFSDEQISVVSSHAMQEVQADDCTRSDTLGDEGVDGF